MSRITRKCVFEHFSTRYDSNRSTTTSYSLEISGIETWGIILSRQRTTKVLISLRGIRHVFAWCGPHYIVPSMNNFRVKSHTKCNMNCLLYMYIPINSSHAVRDLGRVRQYPPWMLFAAFVDSVGYPRYNPQKTRKQWCKNCKIMWKRRSSIGFTWFLWMCEIKVTILVEAYKSYVNVWTHAGTVMIDQFQGIWKQWLQQMHFISSHAVRDLSRVRQYPPWLLFTAFVDSVGYPRYNPQKTCKQWRTPNQRFHWLWGWFPDLKIIFMM